MDIFKMFVLNCFFSADGYVPPTDKPGLNLPFPLNENGYLKMNKEPAADRLTFTTVTPSYS